jgi:hypothetical protein
MGHKFPKKVIFSLTVKSSYKAAFLAHIPNIFLTCSACGTLKASMMPSPIEFRRYLSAFS